MLSRARRIVNSDVCLYLYKQLILPVLDYVDYIYDGLSQYKEYSLQRLQNGAARRILQVHKQTPSAYTHDVLHMDNLSIRCKKHTLIMLFKILNDLSPPVLKDKFTFIHDISSKTTRQSSDLQSLSYFTNCTFSTLSLQVAQSSPVLEKSVCVVRREIKLI